jgi:hypothetical protein
MISEKSYSSGSLATLHKAFAEWLENNVEESMTYFDFITKVAQDQDFELYRAPDCLPADGTA